MSRSGRCARRATLAGVLVAMLLVPVLSLAAGEEVGEPKQTAAAGVRPSERSAQHKVSPYVKARARAQAVKPEHQPKLRLSVRGMQKAGSR